MKKSLCLLFVFALVFSLFSSLAFAADITTVQKYEVLKSQGLLTGFPDGSSRLNEQMTRAQFAVVASKIFGLDVSAAHAPAYASFRDVPGTPASFQWAYRFVEAAAKAGYFVGNQGSFSPARSVSIEEMAIVYAKALGLPTNNNAVVIGTHSWSTKYVDAAINAGIIPANAVFQNEASRAQLVDASYVVNLIVRERNRIAKVTSVTAINLKQIEIRFDGALLPAAAANLANYHVGSAAAPDTNIAGSVEFQANSKSVIITLSGVNQLVNFSTANKVMVRKAVGLSADYVNTAVSARDIAIPTAVQAKATGSREVTLWFSEPLNAAVSSVHSAASLQLDSGTIAIDPTSAIYNAEERSLVIKTYANLSEASSHTISVNATGSNLVDLSGYKVIPNTLTFTYVKDPTPPTVRVLSSTEKTVTFKFSDAVTNVKTSNVVFSHSYSGANPVLGSSGAVVMDSPTTYTVTFPNPLPPGTASVFINYATAAGTPITNHYDIAYAASSMTVYTVADVTKPIVSHVEFVNATSIKVTFSENLNEASAENRANYTLTAASGEAVAIGAAVLQADAAVVQLTTAVMNGGSYILTIKAIKDASVSGNSMADQTMGFTGADTVPPYVIDMMPGGPVNVQKVAANKVVVQFSEVMDRASIENKANWRYHGTVLAADDTIAAFANNMSVVITIALGVNEANDLIVGPVKDMAGNLIAAFATNLDINPITTLAPTAVEATSQHTVVLKYAEMVMGTTTGDLEVSVNNGAWTSPAAVSDWVIDNKTTTTLTIAAAIANTDVPVNYVRVRTVSTPGHQGVSANMRNAYGTQVNIAAASAADKIAPKLVTAQVTGAKQITLTYSESIRAASASIYTYTAAGTTILSVTNLGNNKIVLNTADAVGTNPAVTQVYNIEDTSGNLLIGSAAAFGMGSY